MKSLRGESGRSVQFTSESLNDCYLMLYDEPVGHPGASVSPDVFSRVQLAPCRLRCEHSKINRLRNPRRIKMHQGPNRPGIRGASNSLTLILNSSSRASCYCRMLIRIVHAPTMACFEFEDWRWSPGAYQPNLPIRWSKSHGYFWMARLLPSWQKYCAFWAAWEWILLMHWVYRSLAVMAKQEIERRTIIIISCSDLNAWELSGEMGLRYLVLYLSFWTSHGYIWVWSGAS